MSDSLRVDAPVEATPSDQPMSSQLKEELKEKIEAYLSKTHGNARGAHKFTPLDEHPDAREFTPLSVNERIHKLTDEELLAVTQRSLIQTVHLMGEYVISHIMGKADVRRNMCKYAIAFATNVHEELAGVPLVLGTEKKPKPGGERPQVSLGSTLKLPLGEDPMKYGAACGATFYEPKTKKETRPQTKEATKCGVAARSEGEPDEAKPSRKRATPGAPEGLARKNAPRKKASATTSECAAAAATHFAPAVSAEGEQPSMALSLPHAPVWDQSMNDWGHNNHVLCDNNRDWADHVPCGDGDYVMDTSWETFFHLSADDFVYGNDLGMTGS